MSAHPHQAAQGLARVLQDASRKNARREFAGQLDDFATVVELDPVVISLHSGIEITEDACYFTAGCAPESLAVDDVVVVMGIDGEHVVVGKAAVGAAANPAPTPTLLVSTLPSVPPPSGHVYYQAASMVAAGIAWHLLYDWDAVGLYPWVFLGGGALAVEGVGGINNGTMESTTSLTFTTLTTPGPAITVPLAGEYDVQALAQGNQVGASAAPGIRIWKTGDGSVSWTDSETLFFNNAAGSQAPLSARRRVTVVAGDAIELRYASSHVGGVSFRNRNLWVTPRRVGS